MGSKFYFFFLLIIISINCGKCQIANWQNLGPDFIPTNYAGGGANGIGRSSCIRFDPGFDGTNNNTFYLGTPFGGLWKTDDGGLSWNSWNTDNLPFIGIADIAIDPTNAQIMYVSTGDPDGELDPNTQLQKR